jgi:hypothetical protein
MRQARKVSFVETNERHYEEEDMGDTARKERLGAAEKTRGGGQRRGRNSGERESERKAEESWDHVDRHHRHMEGALRVDRRMESARQRHWKWKEQPDQTQKEKEA